LKVSRLSSPIAGAVEQPANGAQQGASAEGLLDEGASVSATRFPRIDHDAAMAGSEEDPQAWLQLPRAVGQGIAAHICADHIGQQYVDWLVDLLQGRECVRGPGCVDHSIAGLGEDPFGHPLRVRFVLDHKDRLASTGSVPTLCRLCPRRRRARDREVDLGRGPYAGLRVDVDPPLSRRDDLVCGPQRLGARPRPRVAHLDPYIATRLHVRMHLGVLVVQVGVFGLDQQPAAVFHRVARVERELDQEPLDLRRVGFEHAQVVGDPRLERDPPAECSPQRPPQAAHEQGKVGWEASTLRSPRSFHNANPRSCGRTDRFATDPGRKVRNLQLGNC
jgi:hypothetical protein